MTRPIHNLSIFACNRRLLAALLVAAIGWPAHAAQTNTIEDLTWTEVRARLAAGSTTILVPIGGTEQNGPYMVIGKHNIRARVLAAAIAQRLGNALVAPVMAYVPEGSITPPAAHMRFTGTISISESAFEAVLESTARSFKQHGFRDIVFLGDHGGYQKSEQRVADRLNAEWAKTATSRVHALAEYYQATQGPYIAALKKRGFSDAEIGVHAGLADTSLTLAIDPSLVRSAALAHAGQAKPADGVSGDPRKATRELGQLAVDQVVQSSADAITQLTRKLR